MDWLSRWIGGQADNSAPRRGSGIFSSVASAKVVRKPWGEERWLVPEGGPFAFKAIVIRAGMRTSLQYHERKEEANLVLQGSGYLLLAADRATPPATYELEAGDVVPVRPGTVHRIEARQDLIIVEVSTPELDDVIRIADDTARGSGRIDAEHRSG